MSKRKFFGGSDDGSPDSEADTNQSTGTGTESGDPSPSPGDAEASPPGSALTTQQASATSLADAPQAVRDAAERAGGEPAKSAPKAGEGTNAQATPTLSHPELEPPPPPTEYRVAPTAPEQIERESWGERPAFADVEEADQIRVRTLDERSAGIFAGGILVRPEPTTIAVATIRERSEGHLRALVADARIEIQVV